MQIQKQSFNQEQRLKMNPRLYQSIRLLELPVMDLRTQIDLEMERNPALEITEDNSTVPLDESDIQQKDENEEFDTSSDYERTGTTSGKTSDEHRQFIEGALTRTETLQEHLLRQLQLEPADDELRLIAETLIQNLDDDGFHIEEPESLFSAPQQRLFEAIKLVRELEPAGTCVKDYRESLKVQLEMIPDMPMGAEKILDRLDLLLKEKYVQLEKITGLSKSNIQSIDETIKKLSPFPGRFFSSTEARFVIPDIKVIRDNNEFIIILNDEAFPALGINKFYEELGNSEGISGAEKNTAAREFAKKNVIEARIFINHLKRRNQTLIKTANAIIHFQRSFFINGPGYLVPLTLGTIAQELNVHEATISRTANGKYMQTEWGIFEIRYFFTNSIGTTGSSGFEHSKESVKETIKKIILSENRLLSDNDISVYLAQKGIALARRTVAKYRKELDIGSSYTRSVNTQSVNTRSVNPKH